MASNEDCGNGVSYIDEVSVEAEKLTVFCRGSDVRYYKVFGRRHPRCQPRAPAAGVRKAPRHEIAVGERRRCRNYGDFAAGSGVDVVERGGNVGNFAARHVRELNCERVTDRLCNAILRF